MCGSREASPSVSRPRPTRLTTTPMRARSIEDAMTHMLEPACQALPGTIEYAESFLS